MKFIYEGKEFDAEHIKHLFEQKTELSKEEILNAIDLICNEAKKQHADTAIVVEQDNRLDFEIAKEKNLD